MELPWPPGNNNCSTGAGTHPIIPPKHRTFCPMVPAASSSPKIESIFRTSNVPTLTLSLMPFTAKSRSICCLLGHCSFHSTLLSPSKFSSTKAPSLSFFDSISLLELTRRSSFITPTLDGSFFLSPHPTLVQDQPIPCDQSTSSIPCLGRRKNNHSRF